MNKILIIPSRGGDFGGKERRYNATKKSSFAAQKTKRITYTNILI